MSLVGADTDELRDAGQKCEEGKEVTDQVITYLRALIAILRAASFFSGGASAAYAQYLETVVVPWLQKISMALGLFAKVLNANAEAQDQASNGQSVDFGALPSYTPQTTSASTVQPFTGSVLGDVAGGIAAVQAITGALTGGDDATGTATSTSSIPTCGTSSIAAAQGLDSGLTGPAHHSEVHGVGIAAPGADGHGGGAGIGGGPGGSGGGSGSVGGGGSSLGTGSIDGSIDGSGTGSLSTDSSPSVAGGFGGSTPGADSLGGSIDSGAGAGSGATDATSAPSYGAAAGIAGGAAALGLGGAALANRNAGAGDPTIDKLAGSNHRGSSGTDVKELQERLTQAGYDTQGADGKWGANTQAAYDAYRHDNPLPIQAGSGYTSPDGFDYTKVSGVRGNANVTPEFLRGVEGVAQRVGARPEHLMAAMSFETGGTFASDVRNPRSSATGLIQFMDGTARGLGTTTGDLARMSPTEQLTYVERYFEPYRGRLGDLESVYTTILSGRPHEAADVLFSQGQAAYGPNHELDFNHDGRITAAEATSAVRSRLGN
ncbi:MAG: hypothetical protein JWN22_3843 [Nocardioides sp.]|jgi:hypothetical protein|nr:hypothetical protein [Nocardioides sp.]